MTKIDAPSVTDYRVYSGQIPFYRDGVLEEAHASGEGTRNEIICGYVESLISLYMYTRFGNNFDERGEGGEQRVKECNIRFGGTRVS